MTVDDVVTIANSALYLIIKTAAPVLLVSLAIGLIVSIFQTITSIHEQTLTFVPKVIGVFATIMILGHWMLNGMVNYMVDLWSNLSVYVK